MTTPVTTGEGSSTPKVLMFGGFGLAVVGVGVGAVTGLMSWSKTSELQDVCPNNRCPADKQSEIDSTKSLGTIANIAFIAGGVGAGIGVVGLVISRNDKKEASASARAASGLGLRAGAGPRGARSLVGRRRRRVLTRRSPTETNGELAERRRGRPPRTSSRASRRRARPGYRRREARCRR